MNHTVGKSSGHKSYIQSWPDQTIREAWCLKFDDIDCVDFSLKRHQDTKTRLPLERKRQWANEWFYFQRDGGRGESEEEKQCQSSFIVLVSSCRDTVLQYGKGRNISITRLRYSANHNALDSWPIRAHLASQNDELCKNRRISERQSI